MRKLNSQEVETTQGGSTLADLAGVIVGGVLADMGAPAVAAGLIGYGVTQGIEYDSSNVSASQAVSQAYTTGAAV